MPSSLQGKKLGLLIAARPGEPNFERGLKLAETALSEGVRVYLYCIDEAVAGIELPRVQSLQTQGVHLYACAYGAQKRNLTLRGGATFAGLATLNDFITATDRFLCFT